MLDKHMKYPEWQKPYRAALVEVNPQKRVMWVRLSGDRDVRLGITNRTRLKDAACAANN